MIDQSCWDTSDAPLLKPLRAYRASTRIHWANAQGYLQQTKLECGRVLGRLLPFGTLSC